MFPFRFDFLDNKKYDREFSFYRDSNISERLDIQKLYDVLAEPKSESKWKYINFNLKKVLKNKELKYYNEFAYFYDYAREALYNLSKKKDKNFFTDELSYYFEHKDYNGEDKKDNIYQIETKDKLYELDIDGVSLRIFTTGVAVLSIELYNRKYPELKDIKAINEYGRRFYPPFLKKDKDNKAKSISIVKKGDKSNNENKKSKVIEDCENLAVSKNEIRIDEHLMKLLGVKFTQKLNDKEKFFIQPILDDRMFVMCWYGDDEFSKSLVDEKYVNNDEWYQYVFVDNGEKTVFSQKMQEQIIKDATYDRWMDYKWGLTLFGVSRYSFVCLTGNNDFGRDTIRIHIETMYFQMMILLLANRASILRFSDEIAAVANSKNLNRLQPLYEKYLTFYNRLYFKEVTHQEQGIELYDTARKQMRIDEHMEKLDNKFSKLFEYADLKENNETNDYMNKLTVMGAVFLPPSIMIALFSMGIFDYNKSWVSLGVGLFATFLSGVLGYKAIKLFRKNNEKD